MRTIIIDDEKENITHLKKMVQLHFTQVELLGEASNAREAMSLISATAPDLLLLDIIMPGKSAFDMLSEMGSYDFDVIFVTGHDEYGIQAIKFSALDYLLKPVQSHELGRALRKAEQRKEQRQAGQQIVNLLSILKETQKHEHQLALPVSPKEIRFVRTSDIIRCEAKDCYTRFHLSNGEQLLVARGLYEYDELLVPYHFVRCHRSHIVNKSYIKSFFREDWGELLMSDNQRIPVSRSLRPFVKDMLFSRTE